MRISFELEEADIARFHAALARGKVQADILLPGQTKWIHRGELSFLDNRVDESTGTIAARALIANSDFSLLPGQYVRIRLHVGEVPNALMIPQTALGSNQLGKYVYVVSKASTAEQHLVSLGPTDGGLVTIVKGVAEGDKIIDGNLQKIGPGSPVHPVLEKMK